ncbi:eukaryotic membrane protein family-domain-containing protein [Suillus tomentosus]|nr:eukaryotic membrane protein family-domain-containing protein [Suillus tomentosus]
MATSPRRSRRRFSSASIGATWNAQFSPLSTPVSRGRHRRSSSVDFDDDVIRGSDVKGEKTINAPLGDQDLECERMFEPELEVHPLTYASLPTTPILPSPPASPPPIARSQELPKDQPLFSLWDYLWEELLATDFDSHQELKWERVSNFLNIPLAMEKIIGFGFILCLDSFLYTFTILPIRFALATIRCFLNFFKVSKLPLPPSQKADIIRMMLLVVSIMVLIPLTDASKIYHSIRGQDTIKLYVIFNALEIADRLCASIGQDILDCLFSRSTLEVLSRRVPVTSNTLRPFVFFGLATLYMVCHSLVMIYQLLSLNVAVNSYDHALLTLLVSNQFVEIKGSVFKKFEKDNLFQITCADIVERFTLSLMLLIVAFRNLIELSGSEFDFTGGFALPMSFGWFMGNNILWTISYPVVTVMASEILVDWLKHAFISKFNHIRPSVYERYTDVLCRDLASGSAIGRLGARKHSYVDQSPLVARRLGFASLPLAVVVILVGLQSLTLVFSLRFEDEWGWDTLMDMSNAEVVHLLKWAVMGVAFWLCFLALKVLLGVNLISYATCRRAGMEARAAADTINDFGRDPIGEGKEEREYNKQLKKMVDDWRDDAVRVGEMGEGRMRGGNGQGGGGDKKRVPLEELTRFTMVKRIW